MSSADVAPSALRQREGSILAIFYSDFIVLVDPEENMVNSTSSRHGDGLLVEERHHLSVFRFSIPLKSGKLQ